MIRSESVPIKGRAYLEVFHKEFELHTRSKPLCFLGIVACDMGIVVAGFCMSGVYSKVLLRYYR